MSTSTPINRGSFTTYTIGFILSVGLTLGAYIIVSMHTNSGHIAYSHDSLTIAVMVFAILQLVEQLLFFLHLGSEAKPKWNIVTFLFMLLVVLIVGIGSIWIMNNLNYNMMHNEHDMNNYMHEQSQKGF